MVSRGLGLPADQFLYIIFGQKAAKCQTRRPTRSLAFTTGSLRAAPAGVWSRADFLDIGTPNAVEKALQRLTLRGDIRRPYRGLYDKPGVSKLTGKMVFPPRASFIDAIVRRDKLRVLVDGMTAANDLGLTTAVPARSTIYADTYPRTIEIEASAGDPKVTKPVIYKLDFKRIAAKTAFLGGPAGHAHRPGASVVSG